MSKIFKVSEMKPGEVFKLMLSFIAPRPIGWISTISDKGVPNLAPFSFFNMLGNNPATLAFSPAISRDGRKKDTLLNVQQTKCFVHNVVTREVADTMNLSSTEYPYGVSEFEKVGLTALPSALIAAPRVKEALINVECKLMQIVSLGEKPGNGQIVFGEVVAIHIQDESLIVDGVIDSSRVEYLARMGRDEYSSTKDRFSMKSPRE
ncbi:MAG: flavin reductase family protein [Deltaproteobacteria bacterium]|nr:flavin reductase family protein [Deltaproteobacteria bacterium]